MEETKIRLAVKSDVVEIVGLVQSVLEEFGLQFGKGSDSDLQVSGLPESYTSHGGIFWVVTLENKVVGTCGLFPVGNDIYELRKMYVNRAARGLGLGKQLYNKALDWVQQHGGRQIVLDTVHHMERAIKFYESHGFVRDDSQIKGERCNRGYFLNIKESRA